MLPHVNQTLCDLRELVDRLNSTIETLELLDPANYPPSGYCLNMRPVPLPTNLAESPEPAPPEEQRGRLKLQRRPRLPLPTSRAAKKAKLTNDADRSKINRVLKIIGELPEPFSVKQVCQAARINGSEAHWRMQYWRDKGWITQTGRKRGEYVRGPRFPDLGGSLPQTNRAVGGLVSVPPPPLNDGPHTTQEKRYTPQGSDDKEQYRNALTARDRARESGNDRLAEIHQKRVDELGEKLGYSSE